jgi:serine phosphatase RsbU (regulator of sigma subunit)
VVIGDIGGHGQQAAAAMAQTRAMLRALLYERFSSPSAVLTQLDRTLEAITDAPPTTISLARLRPGATGWRMHWSTAGHLAPLLLPPGEPGRYLDAEPGLPLGVDTSVGRPDQHHRLPGGATLVFFTDGLVEHRQHPIDEGLATLARLATQHAGQPPERLCHALVGHHPGDGSDDTAILALRLPPDAPGSGHRHHG